MRAVYTGHEALTFTDYTDLETGKTLHAEPGRTYDIAPASGRLVPDIPEPWFAKAGGEVEVPESGWLPEAAVEPESVPEPEPASEQGDEEGQPS